MVYTVYVREYTYTVHCTVYIVYSIHVYCIHCILTRLLYTVQDMYTVQSNIDRYRGNMSSLLFWGVNLGVNVHTVVYSLKVFLNLYLSKSKLYLMFLT